MIIDADCHISPTTEGGVSIDGDKVPSGTLEIPAEAGKQMLFKAGKRRFARVTFE